MTNAFANNKLIAKNIFLFYFRILLAISFCTSLVVLDCLGITDYGI